MFSFSFRNVIATGALTLQVFVLFQLLLSDTFFHFVAFHSTVFCCLPFSATCAQSKQSPATVIRATTKNYKIKKEDFFSLLLRFERKLRAVKHCFTSRQTRLNYYSFRCVLYNYYTIMKGDCEQYNCHVTFTKATRRFINISPSPNFECLMSTVEIAVCTVLRTQK